MKTKLHLRIKQSMGLAAIITIGLTSCAKEEAVLPAQEQVAAAAVKTNDHDRLDRGRRAELSRDERTMKDKIAVREEGKDKVYFSDGRRQEVFSDNGNSLDRSIRSADLEKRISIHEGQQLGVAFDQIAVKMDPKQQLGQDIIIDSRHAQITQKTNVHEALDFSPAQGRFLTKGERKD